MVVFERKRLDANGHCCHTRVMAAAVRHDTAGNADCTVARWGKRARRIVVMLTSRTLQHRESLLRPMGPGGRTKSRPCMERLVMRGRI